MNITVAYKKSDIGHKVLGTAIEQARKSGGTVNLVTSLRGSVLQGDAKSLEAQDALEEAKTFVEKEGVACDTHLLVRGQPSKSDIIEFAKESHADLIVIGLEKKTRLGQLILGSTAHDVASHADCPILIVK